MFTDLVYTKIVSMEKHCIHTLFYALEQTSRICRDFAENNFRQNVGHNITPDKKLKTVY